MRMSGAKNFKEYILQYAFTLSTVRDLKHHNILKHQSFTITFCLILHLTLKPNLPSYLIKEEKIPSTQINT